jgi:beta-lactam-binding protein with PASTA domain/tRNA A-37 threonylcarbamoyl transferase component Bud32
VIGLQLGGRYEVLERIGGGGMALVYKAHDILLNRFVAVKVLRQQYVNDEEFIRRFRREAQSAASLSHPNIVSIYDVGQEQEIHYIIMEYVEGVTLNDIIKERAPLQVEEAIRFACQICDALEHAHVNHIIHRDIKPHNILIGKNGRVKVTDFGIARATSSSTITQTGSVVGSVHYFSPEHAKGTLTGAKSDLYSLGIVLYQMLTAHLPFIGESPISVALKHLQEMMVEPRKVNPLIPQSVENIILKSTRKNQDERYQSAKEMLVDLDSCLLPQRRNEPKLVFLKDGDHDDETTRVIPAIRASDYVAKKEVAQDEENWEPKRNYWIGPLIWGVIFLVTISVLWFGLLPYIKNHATTKDVKVPDVKGQNVKAAEKMITDVGLKPVENYQSNDKILKDIVISQSPVGLSVKEGAPITLFISSGFEKPKMANYSGRKWQDVRAELLNAGVDEKSQITIIPKSLPDEKDTIVKQDPNPDEEYDPAAVHYTFTVSSGSEKIAMPDLIGKALPEAKNILSLQNLSLAQPDKVGIIYKPSFEQPKDKIFKQFPFKAGEDVDPGQNTIIVWVSTGPPADAGEIKITVKLVPANEGSPSTFRFTVKDAKNDNVDQTPVEISKTEFQTIKVTVTKDIDAVVNFYRDNVFYDTKTYTYKDFLNQTTIPAPSVSPSGSPSPTPAPTTKQITGGG